ncbi:C40 family peptidase [Jatrophihabitans sp. GAS493]|uniref:C40 family peptidase n=1 Tax=Jatrophihabitans sp. GAS493 TaxID=1907575 RepID=UPI000BB993E8|nr:C40 family peptidase [Jatrophihabitans sp. GAS493]
MNDCHITGFDCSGLVQYAYAHAGLTLPHSAAAQYNSGPHIDRADLQPGDLLFLSTDPSVPQLIHHVVIWLGNDSIIQAPESGQLIDIVTHPFTQPGFARQYAGATRPTLLGA